MTSLHQQLERLAVPQTNTLVDSKKKASILFEVKEAAEKERKTIYDLGCNGLANLIVLNPLFKQFEDTLFADSTLHMERSVETREVNQLIDKNVKKFLFYLSPYFMLRPAHMCLEWLIRRFEIHCFNANEFIALILPYHETKLFIKCLQTLKIRTANNPWNWLKPLQKQGISLSKTILLNKATTCQHFLSFICNTFIEIVKEFGNKANILQTQINFYCSAVSGAFDKVDEIKEWHISTILPSLLLGLKSDVVDIVSAAYIIVSQLCRRTKLTSKIVKKLWSLVCEVRFDNLRTGAILLLNLILENQNDTKLQLQDFSLLKLIKNEWLTDVISNLTKNNICMDYLYEYLISGSLREMLKNREECDKYISFIDSFLLDVPLSSEAALNVVRYMLDGFQVEKSTLLNGQEEIFDLSSDNENFGSETNFQEWYSGILLRLERQYPVAFDLIVKQELKSEENFSSERAKVIRMCLACRLKKLDEGISHIYENVYHHNSKIRGLAVQELTKKISEFLDKPEELAFLKEALADRLADENIFVLKEVLKMSTNVFLVLFGGHKFAGLLSNILYKAEGNKHAWCSLAPGVLHHFTSSELIETLDTNMILLSLIPFFMPVLNDEEILAENIKTLSTSLLSEKLTFLRKVRPENILKNFLTILSQSKDKPNPEDLLQCIQNFNDTSNIKYSMNFSQFLLFVTTCINEKTDPEISNNIFQSIQKYCGQHKFVHESRNQDSASYQQHTVSLQIYLNFINKLVLNTNFTNLHMWDVESSSHKFFMIIFDLCSSNAFSENNSQVKLCWSKSLKELFCYAFPQIDNKIDFLSNFFIRENLSEIQSTRLRIRSFKLLNLLLKQNDQYPVQTSVCLKTITALSSKSQIIRRCSLETLEKLYTLKELDCKLRDLIETLLEKREEITIDNEQFPLVMFIAITIKQRKAVGGNVLNTIVNEIIKQNDPIFKVKLLESIKHIKNQEALEKLTPLAVLSLNQIQIENDIKIVIPEYAHIYKLIVNRFDELSIQNTVNNYKYWWSMFEESLSLHDVFMVDNDMLIPVPYFLLENLYETAIENLPNTYKTKLVSLIIKAAVVSDSDKIFLTSKKLIKRCTLDSSLLLPTLNSMANIFDTAIQNKCKTTNGVGNGLFCESWKEGLVLLEFLESNRKLLKSYALIPILFNILENCLNVEDQGAVEYVKQLTLSIIHQCYLKSTFELKNIFDMIPKTTFRIDQIVKCIRETHNPQTNYNALLLLSDCAHIIPQEVLHNIVDIFTFMGSSIIRQDDAFSFHIISSIIESIIPILAGKTAKNKSNTMIVSVLKVFSDIMLDVPEHRRILLYNKLFNTLGPNDYLWVFLCVVFDSHVTNDENYRTNAKNYNQKHNEDKLPKRVEYAIQLTNTFTPDVILQTCIGLMSYIQKLPMQKEETENKANHADEFCLFDINVRTAKQLRHFKYILVQFLSIITSSKEFLENMSCLSIDKILQLKPHHQNFIIKILMYVPVLTNAVEKALEHSQMKFWKIILHHTYDVLDNVISLLSPDMFLVVINGLMQHKTLTIRKRVIEILIGKLQNKNGYFDECSDDNLKSLLQSFNHILNAVLPNGNNLNTSNTKFNETVHVQQTALIAIKSLSKTFALKHIIEFQNILRNLNKILKMYTRMPKSLLPILILTIVEISSNLKAHSIAHLTKFLPHFIEILNNQAEMVKNRKPDNVLLALLSGILKLFEALPLFLGRYIENLLAVLSVICSQIKAGLKKRGEEKIIALVLNKLSSIWSKIAVEIPTRILIPHCSKVYNTLLNSKCVSAIGILMRLPLEVLSISKNSDLTCVHAEFVDMFFQAIKFRDHMKDHIDLDEINETEDVIGDAFVSWVLKLSETSFKPLYHKLYQWAMDKGSSKECVLSYFVLTNKISEALKSLFVIFASSLLQDAVRILNECNTSKNEKLFFAEENKNTYLLQKVLSTLQSVFTYSNKSVVSSFHYENLMQPLVDQLENKLVWKHISIQELLYTCMSALVTTTSSDVFWKQLNYQVLLKTRTNIPDIRIISFNCCVKIAKKLGEDFVPLLPETIPFVAELLEDDNARVEDNVKPAIRELELIVGESLQTYF